MDVNVNEMEPASVAMTCGIGMEQEGGKILRLSTDALVVRTELHMEKISITGQAINALVPVLLHRLKLQLLETVNLNIQLGESIFGKMQKDMEIERLVKSIKDQDISVKNQAKIIENGNIQRKAILESKSKTFDLYQKELRKIKRLESRNRGLQTRVNNLTRKKK